jgi:protein SCO1/2
VTRKLLVRLPLSVFLLIAVSLLSSCHRTPKRYPFTGLVISIDSQDQSALINGADISGFMDAMAMSYKFKPASTLTQLAPGDSISAEVVVVEPATKSEDAVSEYWLENVRIIAHGKLPPAQPALHVPRPGEEVPDFVLTNQNGKRVSIHQYRGKILLVTFIYTRCPFPDFCPRMSANFAEVYKQLKTNPALANTRLLSISFDPEHDTPKALRDYGFSVAPVHDASLFARWEFAVPAAADLPKIADFFALTVKPDAKVINHTLSTAVIGPNGQIVQWYHGGSWPVSDLIKDVESTAKLQAGGK